jgi:hypothetical protein
MKALILLLLVFASPCARAETIYKSIDPKGGIIYSDEPIHGAKIVERYDAPNSEPGPLGPKTHNDASGVGRAQRALADAERALAEGRDPLPHERKEIVGGGTRLTEDYFQRVLALERAVEKARLRLQQVITRAD